MKGEEAERLPRNLSPENRDAFVENHRVGT